MIFSNFLAKIKFKKKKKCEFWISLLYIFFRFLKNVIFSNTIHERVRFDSSLYLYACVKVKFNRSYMVVLVVHRVYSKALYFEEDKLRRRDSLIRVTQVSADRSRDYEHPSILYYCITSHIVGERKMQINRSE